MYLTPRNSSGVVSFAVSTDAVASLVDDPFDDGWLAPTPMVLGRGSISGRLDEFHRHGGEFTSDPE